ncbi:MAG: hypothetical protein HY258_05460 [Chloroflexi bacterium]|nr:hypothetical protein [Chloroflexota bacterium]
MSKNEITVPRKLVYAIAIGAVLLGSIISVSIKKPLNPSGVASTTGLDLPAGSAEKFAFLSGQGAQRSVGST